MCRDVFILLEAVNPKDSNTVINTIRVVKFDLKNSTCVKPEDILTLHLNTSDQVAQGRTGSYSRKLANVDNRVLLEKLNAFIENCSYLWLDNVDSSIQALYSLYHTYRVRPAKVKFNDTRMDIAASFEPYKDLDQHLPADLYKNTAVYYIDNLIHLFRNYNFSENKYSQVA